VESYYLIFGKSMSKIGQKTINISSSVNLTIKDRLISIKGSQGEISLTLPTSLTIVKNPDNTVLITRSNDDKKTKSLHGLYRQLVQNAVTGVETPWTKTMEIVGTGYNVKMQGEDLVFKIGYSHPVVFKKIIGIKYQTNENKVTIIGADRQLVGQVAYQMRLIKKPDSYKGKGVKYEGEVLRIKPGKKAKAAGAAAA